MPEPVSMPTLTMLRRPSPEGPSMQHPAAAWRHIGAALGLASLLTFGGGMALAADPPARVGHVSHVPAAAEAWVAVDGSSWQPASPGWVLTHRSAVRTGPQSRVPVRIGATTLRMGAQTQIQFERLDDQAVVVAVAHGRVSVRWEPATSGDRLVLRAAAARLEAAAPGLYHLEARPRQRSAVARVFEGQASAGTDGAMLGLTAGEQLVFDEPGGSTPPRRTAADRTPLEPWAERQEAKPERASARHVAPEVTGVEALDGHGTWRIEPRIGPVWTPRNVDVDWAPYRFGRWQWLQPWGWTWIDDAPWAFATVHYGRWVFLGGRWGWAPGHPGERPVFAPALVGFHAAGQGTGSSATVAWYPLAPGEAWLPPGNPSAEYVRALNAPQGAAARAGSTPRYAHTSFAVTAVPRAVFAGGQPVAPARIELPPEQLARSATAGAAAPPPPATPTESIETSPANGPPDPRAPRGRDAPRGR